MRDELSGIVRGGTKRVKRDLQAIFLGWKEGILTVGKFIPSLNVGETVAHSSQLKGDNDLCISLNRISLASVMVWKICNLFLMIMVLCGKDLLFRDDNYISSLETCNFRQIC